MIAECFALFAALDNAFYVGLIEGILFVFSVVFVAIVLR